MPLFARTTCLLLLLAPTALAQDVPANVAVTAVTLATGGLAEVEGEMDDAAEVMRLAIERPQVADVLRTLVVTGEAPVVSIDLEAAEPVGERSPAGRLLAGDLADPTTVLTALIGEEVEVRGGATQVAGNLLAFTEVTLIEGEDQTPVPALRLSVATADGRVAYATFRLAEPLAIDGPAVDQRMEEVVPALGETVDDGRRELSVRLGTKARAGFSFVVPTTVWRPSYRALIDGENVSLQGWATLENTTGFDWEGIDLSLAVGTPVAYRQDVYTPLRTVRPEAPFMVGRTAEIPIVEEQQAAPIGDAQMAAMPAPGRRSPLPAALEHSQEMALAAPADLVTGDAAVSGSASTVFSVAGRIDLEAGRTLTVPFLDGTEDVDRIAYLDLAARPLAPLDALQLTFDAEATVPGGLIAVYDEAGFVGDARFAGADGGATNILPFAVSADLHARVTEAREQTLASATFVDGALRLTREERTRTTLVLEASEPAALVADQPRRPNETVEVDADAGLGGEIRPLDVGRVRLTVEVPEGTSRIVLVGVQPLVERYRVGNLTGPLIADILSAGDAIDEETRDELDRIAAVIARIAEIDRRIATLEADVADLRDAVATDRENLEAIDVRTPEGAIVRERIIARTEAIDAALEEIRALRRERLNEQDALRSI